MQNNQLILDKKRICYKISLFLNIIFLFFNVFSIFICLEYIEKNRLFYHYCITLFTIFLSTSNDTYYEYIYYKNYGRIFNSIIEYEVWKKQNKNYAKYILRCIEYICLFTFLFHSLPIELNMQENNSANLYKINIFLLQLLTIIIMITMALFIIFFVCMIFSYPILLKKKSTIVKETIVEIDKKNEECSICLDINDKIWIKTRCNHIYHNECITEWLQISKSCPICREQL